MRINTLYISCCVIHSPVLIKMAAVAQKCTHRYCNAFKRDFNYYDPNGKTVGLTFKEMKQRHGRKSAEVDGYFISYRFGDERFPSSFDRGANMADSVVNELYKYQEDGNSAMLSLSIANANTKKPTDSVTFDQFMNLLSKDEPVDPAFVTICGQICNGNVIKGLHVTAASPDVSAKTIELLAMAIRQSMSLELVRIDPMLSHEHMAKLVDAVCGNARSLSDSKAICLDVSPLYSDHAWLTSMKDATISDQLEVAKLAQSQLTKANEESQLMKARKEAEQLYMRREAEKQAELARLGVEMQSIRDGELARLRKQLADINGSIAMYESKYTNLGKLKDSVTFDFNKLKAERQNVIDTEARKLYDSWLPAKPAVAPAPAPVPAPARVPAPAPAPVPAPASAPASECPIGDRRICDQYRAMGGMCPVHV